MPLILKDRDRLDPSTSSPVRPTPPLDPGITSRDSSVTFELESPGGYLRAVTGRIAYLDREAQTYMVRAPGGALNRVPMRNIKRMTESPA